MMDAIYDSDFAAHMKHPVDRIQSYACVSYSDVFFLYSPLWRGRDREERSVL